MEFSENVIAIFDDLAKRFGIIIDWSKDNVFPYLLDVFNRWRMYEIIINIIPFLLLFCFIFIIIKLYLLVIKERRIINKELPTLKKNEIYDYNFHLVAIDCFNKSKIKIIDSVDYTFMILSMCIISLICINFFTVPSLMKAIFVPEMLFYQEFLD